MFSNGCWDHHPEVLDGLKTGYYTEDSDNQELAVPRGAKPWVDMQHVFFAMDFIFSDDVTGEVWIQFYKYGGLAHLKCAGMENTSGNKKWKRMFFSYIKF